MDRITVVCPVFNEEDTVDVLTDRLTAMADGIMDRCAFTFVFVDDGSSDGTFGKLARRADQDSRIMIIRLSRNWGHQPAYNAGLDNIPESDAVVLIDGDLEDPPELIPTFIDHWKAGAQIVYGVKESRVDSFPRQMTFHFYYWMVKHMTDSPLTPQAGMFGLLDWHVVGHLRKFMERNKSYPNLRSFLGFRQVPVGYHRGRRHAGTPKQTLRKLARDGLNAIFAFSYKPIRIMTVIGFCLSIIFGALFLLFLVLRLTGGQFWIFHQVPGWTSAILLVLLLGSYNMVFLGILGEYIARIFDEVRHRPYYIVDSVYQKDDASGVDADAPVGGAPADLRDRSTA